MRPLMLLVVGWHEQNGRLIFERGKMIWLECGIALLVFASAVDHALNWFVGPLDRDPWD